MLVCKYQSDVASLLVHLQVNVIATCHPYLCADILEVILVMRFRVKDVALVCSKISDEMDVIRVGAVVLRSNGSMTIVPFFISSRILTSARIIRSRDCGAAEVAT